MILVVQFIGVFCLIGSRAKFNTDYLIKDMKNEFYDKSKIFCFTHCTKYVMFQVVVQLAIMIPLMLFSDKFLPRGFKVDRGNLIDMANVQESKGFLRSNINFVDGVVKHRRYREGYNIQQTYGSLHFTYCFNIFTLLQFFNMACCKEVNSRFSAVYAFKEKLFTITWFFGLFLHFLVVTFGSKVFRVSLWVS